MQRYVILLLSMVIFSTMALLSCQHDPFQQPVDPENPTVTGFCDPDSVYFQNQILPILVSNCTEPGCHNTIDRTEGVILDSYQNLIATVEHATQNDLHENKLMRAILESDLDDRMPPVPKSALAQDQIDLLKTWLAQGALNNACDEHSGGCNLADATYSAFIQPMVQTKCKGCHSGSNPQGGLKLTTYAEIQSIALNGKFLSVVNQTTNWMPKGGAKLDNCSIQKIEAWVSAGAPEN